ncbi:MAG: AAA family ATPase [Proteiniphilum sp.]
MERFTDRIIIENFKSIRRIELEDCRRINLLIGKPNVGKSNILEAFSSFCLPYARHLKNKSIQQFIRTESEAELFFNGDIHKDILITVGENSFRFSFNNDSSLMKLSGLINDEQVIEVSKLNIKSSGFNQPEEIKINSYFFNIPFRFEDTPLRFLQPTNGCNLYRVLKPLSDLTSEISNVLAEYRLKLSFESTGNQLKFWKELPSGEIFTVPFNSMADTLQRMIFYKTAIASNKNSIITFEEPEANSYPPYISKLTADILYSISNQFFITTHSPYVVNDFLEENGNELAIYLVDYREGETVVRRLTDEELNQVYNNGIDLFFNNEIFQ